MLMTPAEFDAVVDYDDEYRYELINGVLVVQALAPTMERDVNDSLGSWLRSYRTQHPQGPWLDRTLPDEYIRLRCCRRRADRVIWAGLGRRPNPKKDVPTIVVEFVSAGRRNRDRDFIEKRDEYRKVGVKEYWIIDRFRRQLNVFRFAGKLGSQWKELVIPEGETYETPLLPGFELPLARILAIADEWNDEE